MKVTKVRWVVFVMLMIAIFINYMDRVNFAVSIPAIRNQFHFSLAQIGDISFAWTLAYALFNFPGGWIADRLRLRNALGVTLGWWSIFTILTAAAGSFTSWIWIRSLMGMGEAPIWAINSKTSRTWAPPAERSRAFTIPGSGQYLGPTIGSILAGWILVNYGWEWTFIAFGLAGLVFIPFWYSYVRDTPAEHPSISPEEVAYIGHHEADVAAKGDWATVQQALGIIFGTRAGCGVLLTFLTFGYILFTFINWVPSYMYYTFHISILKSAGWSSAGFFAGLVGYLLSGPFNDGLARRYPRLTARRIGAATPMVAMIVLIGLSMATAQAGQVMVTALLIALAQLCMNLTVGSWAVNAVDLAPSGNMAGLIYGIYNGVLNLVGAFNALIVTRLATAYGFPVAFGSAIFFMLVFLLGILVVLDHKSYNRLVPTNTVAAD